jgi:hypothetical protein
MASETRRQPSGKDKEKSTSAEVLFCGGVFLIEAGLVS